MTINHVMAMPPLSADEAYKLHDVILLGKVVSKDPDFSPDLVSYKIQVIKYLKNSQNDDTVLAYSSKTSNLKIGNPVFERDDIGLFYLRNVPDTYDAHKGMFSVSSESILVPQEWLACNLFEKEIPVEHWPFSSSDIMIKIYQEDNSDKELFENHKKITISQDVTNHGLSHKTIELGLIILQYPNLDAEHAITMFEEKKKIDLEPCLLYKTISWEFVPSQVGHYFAEITEEGGKYGSSFTVTGSELSPLKQLKSGIPIDEIQCKENLQLVIKASDGSPACVKPETKAKLVEHGWAKLV